MHLSSRRIAATLFSIALALVVLVLAPVPGLACDACGAIEEPGLMGDCFKDNCNDDGNGGCCDEACDCGGGTPDAGPANYTPQVLVDDSTLDLPLTYPMPFPDATGLRLSWLASFSPGTVEFCDGANNCRQESYNLRMLVRMVDDAGSWPSLMFINANETSGVRSLVPMFAEPAAWDPMRDGVFTVQVAGLPPEVAPGETATVLNQATAIVDFEFIALVENPVPTLPTSWGGIKVRND